MELIRNSYPIHIDDARHSARQIVTDATRQAESIREQAAIQLVLDERERSEHFRLKRIKASR